MEMIKELIEAQDCMLRGNYGSMLSNCQQAVEKHPTDIYARRSLAWALALNHKPSQASEHFYTAGTLISKEKAVLDRIMTLATVNLKTRTFAPGEFVMSLARLSDQEALMLECFEGHLVMNNKTTHPDKFRNYMNWLSRGNYVEA